MGKNPSVMPTTCTHGVQLPRGVVLPLGAVLLGVAQTKRKSGRGSFAGAILASSQVVLLLSVLGHIERAAVEGG